jgi:anti-sigma regulatory factor (Ser/Thr protein kinase)/RimJ/RimL family protein N-acetyltransferase
MTERSIATLTLSGRGSLGGGALGGIARSTTRAAALVLGLDDVGADRLADATAQVVDAVAQHAFDDPTEVELSVEVVHRDGAVVVRVDDRGLPFAFRDEDDVFVRALAEQLVDEVHHETRGVEGNRTELVRHFAESPHDIRATSDLTEHLDAVAAPAASDDVKITVRAMAPGDAEGVARLTWRTYGYTYQHHEFYRPDLLGQAIRDGAMRSWVGVTDDGEIVGHSALVFDSPDAPVAEGGRAMVDPRFRGHHVMKSLMELRSEHVGELALYGVYADAVTAHTRSQTLYGGGADQPVSGLLLGYLPPTVTFRRIQTDAEAAPLRQAVVMSYHPRRAHEELVVYPPAASRDVLRRIYDAYELPRTFAEGRSPDAPATTIESRVWRDLGSALLVVTEPGVDFREAVHTRLRSLGGAGIQVVYADLPLAHPATPTAGAILNDLGFEFGGVIPLLRYGSDVLRLQHLGDLAVDRDEIQLVSTMAHELLDFILERREAVS